MTHHIEYWYDRTSNADDPRWIISREDTDTDVTYTLCVLPAQATAENARAVAEQYAAKYALPIIAG